MKPVDLCGGMFVRRVDDDIELRAAVDAVAGFPVNARGQLRSPQILLEECLDGPEFSVETVTVAGQTTVIGVTDKRITGAPAFIESGHMFPAALSDADTTAVADRPSRRSTRSVSTRRRAHRDQARRRRARA